MPTSRALKLLRDDRGFTLMELLVAIVTGVVVTGALLTILEVSLRQQARINDRANANQVGRIAMSAIVDRLHSACTGFGTYPIQGPSSKPTSPLEATGRVNLWFLSQYGNTSGGSASPTGVTQHDINWTATGTSNTGKQLGTLTDYAFESSGGSSPKWTFPTLAAVNAKATILAKNVIPQAISGASTIFQYYKYEATKASSTFGQLQGPLIASELPEKLIITSTEKAQTAANELAKVTIGFTQAPDSADTRLDRTSSLSDAVVLRYTPTETGSEAVNSPCE